MRIHVLVSLAGVLLGVLALSACDVSTPSRINIGKIRLGEQMVTKTVDAGYVDRAHVALIAAHFTRAGKGPLVMTMPYLSNNGDSRTRAEKLGEAYKKVFTQNGVSNFSVVMVPVADPDYAREAVLTYNALVARAPEGCSDLPGALGAGNMDDVNGYRFGCGTQATLSKMIADPSDLMGKGGTQKNDSRRVGPMIEPYKAGTPNQPLKGFQASGIGG